MTRSQTHSPFDRRRFLKAAGISIALPMLESASAVAATGAAANKRLVCIGGFLGFHRPAIYPNKTGRGYELTPILKPLERHREDLTVFSGLDHRAAGGHQNWSNYLCGRKVGRISLDQIVAAEIGQDTRFPSVQLTAGRPVQSMSFTRQGIALPMTQRPSVFYSQLFASPEDRAHTEYLLKSGKSALDTVLDDARRLQKQVSTADKAKLDEYFDSLRDVEVRMKRQLNGVHEAPPTTDYKLPDYDPIAPNLMLEAETLMYDLMALALETDSSRVMTLFLGGLGQVFTIDGVTLQSGYHALSHHGNDPDKIRDLVSVESQHMVRFARFLDQLKTKTDAEQRPLLDSTVVMMGTGMGDSSVHDNRDLPLVVAGGGFKHGRHLATDPAKPDAPMMGNLFVSLLQSLGIERHSFADAQGALSAFG